MQTIFLKKGFQNLIFFPKNYLEKSEEFLQKYPKLILSVSIEWQTLKNKIFEKAKNIFLYSGFFFTFEISESNLPK